MDTKLRRSKARRQSTAGVSPSNKQGAGASKRRSHGDRAEANTSDVDAMAATPRTITPPQLPRVTQGAQAYPKPPTKIAPAFQAGGAVSTAALRSPINVWEFEYPWLEYRGSLWRVVAVLAVVGLLWGAHSHRAELNGYWKEAPQEVHAAWAQCQPYLSRARSLVRSALH